MQKSFVITAFILLSSITVAAQTAEEQKPLSDAAQVEFAKRAQTTPTINASLVSAGTETGANTRAMVRVVDGRVIRFGPTTTYLKNGLRAEEVVRLLGKPITVAERREGNTLLSTYTFTRSEDRLFVAEFENGLLVRSRMEPAQD